jgi:hypothetical protein
MTVPAIRLPARSRCCTEADQSFCGKPGESLGPILGLLHAPTREAPKHIGRQVPDVVSPPRRRGRFVAANATSRHAHRQRCGKPRPVASDRRVGALPGEFSFQMSPVKTGSPGHPADPAQTPLVVLAFSKKSRKARRSESWSRSRAPNISSQSFERLKVANKRVSGRDLEVVDECVVHRCTTERADDRHGLCCKLLRHHHAKAGCDLRNEPDQNRRAFRQHPAARTPAAVGLRGLIPRRCDLLTSVEA